MQILVLTFQLKQRNHNTINKISNVTQVQWIVLWDQDFQLFHVSVLNHYMVLESQFKCVLVLKTIRRKEKTANITLVSSVLDLNVQLWPMLIQRNLPPDKDVKTWCFVQSFCNCSYSVTEDHIWMNSTAIGLDFQTVRNSLCFYIQT